MARKLIAAGTVLLALGVAGVLILRNEPDPIEKRGSAAQEFDREADPVSKPPPKSKRSVGWPTFGYTLQRTKLSPYRHRPPYRRTWRLDALDSLEFPPSAAYGNVYLAQQKGIFYALEGRTGKRVFTKRFKRCAASSPTIAKGVVYQAYMDFVPCPQGASKPSGFVTAMDAKTGKEKWRFWGKPFESTPLLRKGLLYVGSWDGRVYAIRARTGRKVWSFDTDNRVNTSAAYSKGRIFIGNDSGNLYALSARTGRLVWKAGHAREFFYATPAVAYGRVFIGSTDGTMYAYGQRTGRLLWARPLGTYVYSSAAVYDRKVFAGTYDGRFYALDAATGDVRWRRTMPSAVHAPPVVMAGIVYATTCSSCGSAAARHVKMGKDSTYGFGTKTGRKRWYNNGGKYSSAIIADDDRVYFTGRSFLYGMEPRAKKSERARARRIRARRARARRAREKRAAAREKAKARKRARSRRRARR